MCPELESRVYDYRSSLSVASLCFQGLLVKVILQYTDAWLQLAYALHGDPAIMCIYSSHHATPAALSPLHFRLLLVQLAFHEAPPSVLGREAGIFFTVLEESIN